MNRLPLLLALSFSGCAFNVDLPQDKVSGDRLTYFKAPLVKVRDAVRAVFIEWGMELRRDDALLLRTRRYREGDHSWRMNVEITESNGIVALVTTMEIHEFGEFDVRLSEKGLESVVRKLLKADPDRYEERRGKEPATFYPIKKQICDEWRICQRNQKLKERGELQVWGGGHFRETLFHGMVALKVNE